MEMTTTVREQEAALDIEQEYINTLRVRSNARFLSNKQRCGEEMEELIPPVLRNLPMHRRRTSEIEFAMAGYFDASAEASEMCAELLRNIESTQSNYQSMESFLASMSDDGRASTSASDAPAPLALNPFCTARSNFRQIRNKHSSVLKTIRSSHRKVARKLKVAKTLKKLLKACLAVARDAAAAHLMFFGLMVGPAAARLCPIALRKQVTTRTKTGCLLRLRDQLDAAAKGTYVLGKDLDTVSQLVARLSDGIERENTMMMCCVERASEGSSVLEMVSELNRSYSSSNRLAEELKEHVCLCLATIHKAKVLVIQEISRSMI